MKRIFVATVLATFALGSAAMAQDPSCEAKAMGKDGNKKAVDEPKFHVRRNVIDCSLFGPPRLNFQSVKRNFSGLRRRSTR